MQQQTGQRPSVKQLAWAAWGGVLAGATTLTFSGCSQSAGPAGAAKGTGTSPVPAKATAATGEMHACAGLNGCAGQGVDGKNSCAGQGGCASMAMHHECKGHNECKGQGGCGEAIGENACKGQGGCAIPVKDKDAWKMARAKMETKMKAAGKEMGPAPKT
jgi:hypothetical protein